jgi:hypothetical protein
MEEDLIIKHLEWCKCNNAFRNSEELFWTKGTQPSFITVGRLVQMLSQDNAICQVSTCGLREYIYYLELTT